MQKTLPAAVALSGTRPALALAGTLAATATCAAVVLAACASGSAGGAGYGVHSTDVGDGAALFGTHCAVCHGASGEGDGPAAPYLLPEPRDLTGQWFALTSTLESQPTRGDLEALLVRGMPGSAMPSFAFLPGEARSALVDHVLSLRPETARVEDPTVIPAPPVTADTMANRERGAALYASQCAMCHGPEGRGGIMVQPDDHTPVEGYRPARDFTSGILRGPATRVEIARRIVAGVPVAGMPPSELRGRDLALLVDHVMRWIPQDAVEHSEQMVQRTATLDVPRVDALPTDGSDAAFGDGTPVVLSPLAWSDGSIPRVTLTAVHDGEEIAVRLRWEDTTADDRAVGGASGTPDAVAVQWSAAPMPPLLAMGGGGDTVDVWFWQAFRSDQLTGFLDAHAAGIGAAHDVSRRPAPGVVRTDQRARAAAAEGPPNAGTFAEDGIEIGARAEYAGGGWTVVLRRSLAAPARGMVDLSTADGLWLACAVWNGSGDERRGHKSISTWQRIRLR